MHLTRPKPPHATLGGEMRGPGTLRLGSRSASYHSSLLMPLSSRWQDRADGGHPDEREQVVMDPKTLQVLRREPFAAMSRGQRWRSWVRFTHTSEAGGWWGETLALVRHAGPPSSRLPGLPCQSIAYAVGSAAKGGGNSRWSIRTFRRPHAPGSLP